MNLRKFFGLCNHKWEEVERHKITRNYPDGEVMPNCILIILKCKKCGDIKKVDLP